MIKAMQDTGSANSIVEGSATDAPFGTRPKRPERFATIPVAVPLCQAAVPPCQAAAPPCQAAVPPCQAAAPPCQAAAPPCQTPSQKAQQVRYCAHQAIKNFFLNPEPLTVTLT